MLEYTQVCTCANCEMNVDQYYIKIKFAQLLIHVLTFSFSARC